MTTPTYGRRIALSLVVMGIMLFAAAMHAEASHFRSAIIQPTIDAPGVESGGGVSFTVTWRITHSWRRSAFGSPNVGDIVSTGELFDFGDGSTTSLTGEATSINPVEDWVVLNSEFSQTYTFPAATVKVLMPFFQSCCRISTLQEGNNDASFRVEGRVVLDGRLVNLPPPQNVPDQAPSVSNLPVISVIDTGAATSSFLLSASDPEGGQLIFTFAPSTASLLPRPVPTGLTLTSSTGRVTWDLTQLGATTGAGLRVPGNLFATQVIVRDSRNNRTPTDFLLKLVTGAGAPPALQLNGVAADLTLDVFTNDAVSFPVAASDPDPGGVVTLTVAGLPPGATLTPSLPFTATAPATTFEWTPTTPGTTTMTFAATDDVGFVTQRTATIRVTPPNDSPALTCPASVTLQRSVPQTVRVRVADVDGDALAVTWTLDGVLLETDTVAASATPINVGFTHTYAQGSYTLAVAATDGVAQPVTCAIAVNVPGVSTVEFDAATYTRSEGAGATSIAVVRTGSTANSATVRYTITGGTAVRNIDYTAATTRVLTFGPGVGTVSIPITIRQDTIEEAPETMLFALSNPTGGLTLGAHSTAVLTITDDDPAGSLAFAGSVFTVAEGTPSAVITVVRSGGTASGVTVQYATSNGTALAGSDYLASAGTLTFGAGQTSRTFSVPILDDPQAEATETVNLTLSNPGGGGVLGSPATAVLRILDNEPTIGFTGRWVGNGLEVERTGPANMTSRVDYNSVDGTAVAGSDYAALSGTLTFGPGVRTRIIPIVVLKDNAAEGSEDFTVLLSNPFRARLSQTVRKVVIKDNDFGGTVQFSAAGYSVPEGQSRTITVTRTGGAGTALTVRFFTSDGTGIAGENYVATSGDLFFAVGQTSRTFTVRSLFDDEAGNRTVNLHLSVPAGAATLGPRANAVLTVVGSLGGPLAGSLPGSGR